MARDTRKTLKKGEKWKTESIRKVWQRNNVNKIIYFYFLFIYMEKDVHKIVYENVVYVVKFLVKLVLMLQVI